MAELVESSGQPSAPETAIDMTEQERQGLFDAAAHALEVRGSWIDPHANDAPGTRYFDEQSKEYVPDRDAESYIEAEIPAEDFEGFTLPYDKIVIGDERRRRGEREPGMLVIGTKDSYVGSIPVSEQESIAGVGTRTRWVALSRDPMLGIVVEGEEGGAELRPSEDDTQVLRDSEQGRVTLSGPMLYMDEAPPHSRAELLEISRALATIQ